MAFRVRNLPSNAIGTASPSRAYSELPPRLAWMCRCGSVEFPEFPTAPSCAPAGTCSPSLTCTLPLWQVRHEYVHVDSVATQHDMVARRACPVNLIGDRIVRHRCFDVLDLAVTWCVDGRSVARVFAQITRTEARRTVSPRRQLHDIERILLCAIDDVVGDGGRRPALADVEAAVAQRKLQGHHFFRRPRGRPVRRQVERRRTRSARSWLSAAPSCESRTTRTAASVGRGASRSRPP